MTKPAGIQRKQAQHRRPTAPNQQPNSGTRAASTVEHINTTTAITTGIITSPRGIPAECPYSGRGTRGVATAWLSPPESVSRSPAAAQTQSARSFYLGSTSYAGVFAEEGPIPESIQCHPEKPGHQTPTTCVRGEVVRGFGSRRCQVDVAESLVSKIPPFSLLESLLRFYYKSENLSTALDSPFLLNALPRLANDFKELSTAEDKHALYAKITRNTARPFHVPPDIRPSEFHTLYSGENLRWETIGLVLITAAMPANFISPDDPMFTVDEKKIDRDHFIEDMIYASDECISLCQIHGAGNDIMIWMLYHSGICISDFYGDNREYIDKIRRE